MVIIDQANMSQFLHHALRDDIEDIVSRQYRSATGHGDEAHHLNEKSGLYRNLADTVRKDGALITHSNWAGSSGALIARRRHSDLLGTGVVGQGGRSSGQRQALSARPSPS